MHAHPLVRDNQALVMNVKGKGLVIISCCAHSGTTNTVLHARELTRVNETYALVGGFHLSFPNEHLIDPTVEEVKKPHQQLLFPAITQGGKRPIQF